MSPTTDTPLLMAVRGHQELVVMELLKQGVEVNQANFKVSLVSWRDQIASPCVM